MIQNIYYFYCCCCCWWWWLWLRMFQFIKNYVIFYVIMLFFSSNFNWRVLIKWSFYWKKAIPLFKNILLFYLLFCYLASLNIFLKRTLKYCITVYIKTSSSDRNSTMQITATNKAFLMQWCLKVSGCKFDQFNLFK